MLHTIGYANPFRLSVHSGNPDLPHSPYQSFWTPDLGSHLIDIRLLAIDMAIIFLVAGALPLMQISRVWRSVCVVVGNALGLLLVVESTNVAVWFAVATALATAGMNSSGCTRLASDYGLHWSRVRSLAAILGAYVLATMVLFLSVVIISFVTYAFGLR